jgi:flagellar biosynthesis protein FlhF
MNTKKFVAATSREALFLVRNELGADAVILSNKKVADGVEITVLAGTDFAKLTEPKIEPKELVKPVKQPIVAKYEPVPEKPVQLQPAKAVTHETPVSAKVAEQEGILKEIKSMRTMMQEQLASMSWSDMQHRDPKRGQILSSLLNAGFSPALSNQLIEKMPKAANISWVRQVLGNNLRVASQEEDVVVRGGVVALIGPTGVGKTTTTAKLAARAVVRYGAEKVALITTDSYRVGAHEQLRIYGKILGVEVHAVRDTEDLRLTILALKRKHLILIDTMGLGQRDSRVAEQTEMFNATGVQRLLLLNATSGGDTLDEVVHKYYGAGVIGCIPTKLDEAGALGTVLDVAVRHKLTLHYITSGQRVPEDLHEVNLEYLLHRTFKESVKATPFTIRDLDFPALMAGLGTAKPAREAYAL